MKITISTEAGQIVVLDVDSTEVIENVKALIEVETGIPLNQQKVLFNGTILGNATQLSAAGVKDNDLLFVMQGGQNEQPQTPQEVLNYVKSQPQILQRLFQSNPPLAQAIVNEDVNAIGRIMQAEEQRRKQAELEQIRRINQLNDDPFNPEAQRLIEEEIRMKNVEENIEQAIEHNPEAFGGVVMLYVDTLVNGVPVKAFVDSGAQMTIMNQQCAERCGIMRLIDKRWQGIAKGVGEAKILGRIHVAPVKIGNSFFPCSFSVLENQSMEFLIGLDMLRRHQCSIDLKDNVLRIGTEAVPFLAEKDIPKKFLQISDDTEDSIPPEEVERIIKEQQQLQQQQQQQPRPVTTTATTTSTTTTQAKPLQQQQVPRATQQQQPIRQGPSFPEDTVQQLIGLGFSRDEVIRALIACGGNPDLAAGALFSMPR